MLPLLLTLLWMQPAALRANEQLMQQALDQTSQISFSDITLEEAAAQISQRLGVPIELDPAAVAQLPHGHATRLAIRMEGISWREALTELLKPLALEFQAGRDRIYVVGSEELMRQPRRTTIAELDALVKLKQTRIVAGEMDFFDQLEQLGGTKFAMEIDGQMQSDLPRVMIKRLSNGMPVSAARLLDLYGKDRFKNQPFTWYLKQTESGDIQIVMLEPKDLVTLKLQRRVSAEYHRDNVARILNDLAAQASVAITYEPACLAMLDEDVRENCSLVLRSGTVQRALEALAGATGLEYSIDAEGIHIAASENLKEMALAKKTSFAPNYSPTVCTITAPLPGTNMESFILLRQNELEELGLLEKYQQVRQDQIGQFIEFLRNFEATQSK